ncbi:HupE/UreJ family protein [Pseudoduganella namucuonensis]|uniref:Hydrogenase/urease accessory protein HupE n=1 Tax=Pseudoduganella namucuonensis TaxID=1035707 RepID=A0A1I7GDZ0_9BURK|nr:HupE/UreJ family protein [Pseudoduganella namucuonensis]SFU46679.1 Hydrogenase/urease accessory protein HupE [Pseudoduganella namucuonensis]
MGRRDDAWPRRWWLWCAWCAWCGLALLSPGPAQAHLVAGGQGAIRLVGDSAYAAISVPARALAGYDDDRDGRISRAEIDAHRDALGMQLSVMIDLRSGGRRGRVVFEDLLLPHAEPGAPGAEELTVLRRYQWDAPVTAPSVELHLFHTPATADARLALRVIAGERSELALLSRQRNAHQYFAGPWAVFRDFAAAGAGHILLGPDHLLFLLTVLAAGAGWRYWLAVVTSFTVAHSVTLALSALGYVGAPPRVVEPLIAASIVLLALDNLRRGAGAARHRPALVFACGLLHGLGIATALVDMGLSGDNRALSLLGFNLGVELGQLAFVACALGLLALARRASPAPWRAGAPRAGSAVAALVGCYWLAERVA